MKEKEITVVMVEPGERSRVKNYWDTVQKAVSIGADYQDYLVFCLGYP